MQAPVVLFVYNRTDHTKQVIEALSHNDGAADTEVFIYSDAAADETEEGNVRQVRQYLEEVQRQTWFKNVSIILAEQNKGLEKSIIEGVTNIMNRYGRAIVLEDDIVTAPDFLNFMNQALDYYEDDEKIWSISGYTAPSKKIRKSKKDIFIGYRGICWGWASWADRWRKIDWQVSDYQKFVKDKRKQREFNKAGADMTMLLHKQQRGEIRSWAIRWCYQQFKEGMLTVFPCRTKVNNIGLDGSGTNCGIQGNVKVALGMEQKWDFKYAEKDIKLFRELQKKYFFSYIRQKIGYYWYKLTVYEHCIAYRDLEEQDWNYLKPNYKEWYEDAFPFMWGRKKYIFLSGYRKYKKNQSVYVSKLDDEGKITEPVKIIEEEFPVSFPNVFVYKNNIYMIPTCSGVKQIRIYKMQKSILDWNLYSVFDTEEAVVDVAVYQNDGECFLLGSYMNDHNPHQTARICYELKQLDDADNIMLAECWKEKGFSYKVRNGGNITDYDGKPCRIVQHSTKDVCGKFISINEILKLNSENISEYPIRKMDLANQQISLPAFIYRPLGLHTYGKCGSFEVLDVWVQRFSIGGLLLKILGK